MIIGTAGHIDHGKTALVRALTGVDTDRLPEERRRGITIELGFAPFELPGVGTLGVVDVPGHEAFVRTMVAGATGVDLALLVVAADEGVMPQTSEHVAILKLLGVDRCVVALTKADLVDAEWLTLVADDVRAALAHSPFAAAAIVAVSATTGEGLDALRTAIRAAAAGVRDRASDDLFRLPVDRSFTVRGTGTVVTGTVWTGSLARDATVRVLPGGWVGRVRGLQSHAAPLAAVGPGMRVAVALANAEPGDAPRGSVLVTDASWASTTIVRAEVELIEGVAALGPRTRVRFHLGTAEVGARVVCAGGELTPGDRRPARVVLDEPVVCRAADRFVLRRASPRETIGGGVVTDPLPGARRPRPWPTTVARPESRLEILLDEAGVQGVALAELAVRLGVSPAEVASLADRGHTRADRPYRCIRDHLFHATATHVAATRLRQIVAAAQAAAPLEPGVSVQAVRAKAQAHPDLTEALLAELSADGTLEIDGGVVRAGGWKPTLTPAESTVARALEAALEAAGREPPAVAELAVAFGGLTQPLLRHLERVGRVVQVEAHRYYAAPALATLIATLRAGMQPGRAYNPFELRELLGVSRKFLIPLLEFCDRTQVTERRGEGRVIRGT